MKREQFILVVALIVASSFGFACAISKGKAYCKKSVKKPRNFMVNGTTIAHYETKIINTCCEGYKLYRRRCIPSCDQFCMNGKCTKPNYCSCYIGYKKVNDQKCAPYCENCKYGVCISPGNCACYKGYVKNRWTQRCEPICSKPCVNGYCSYSEFCSCYEGFKIAPGDVYTCIPIITTTTIESTTFKDTPTTEITSTLNIASTTTTSEDTTTEEIDSTSTIQLETLKKMYSTIGDSSSTTTTISPKDSTEISDKTQNAWFQDESTTWLPTIERTTADDEESNTFKDTTNEDITYTTETRSTMNITSTTTTSEDTTTEEIDSTSTIQLETLKKVYNTIGDSSSTITSISSKDSTEISDKTQNTWFQDESTKWLPTTERTTAENEESTTSEVVNVTSSTPFAVAAYLRAEKKRRASRLIWFRNLAEKSEYTTNRQKEVKDVDVEFGSTERYIISDNDNIETSSMRGPFHDYYRKSIDVMRRIQADKKHGMTFMPTNAEWKTTSDSTELNDLKFKNVSLASTDDTSIYQLNEQESSSNSNDRSVTDETTSEITNESDATVNGATSESTWSSDYVTFAEYDTSEFTTEESKEYEFSENKLEAPSLKLISLSMVLVLFSMLAIIVMIIIVVASLIFFTRGRLDSGKYNVARLEEKKGTVQYSVDRNDVVTAW